MKRAIIFTLLAFSAVAQEPREPNALKRLQAVEAKVGTSSELGHLVTNCAIENNSTPIPDECVGDGVDGGGGGLDTANSPNANEFARFTDADTIEGRTAAEARADLDLEAGTDIQAFDADLSTWAGLTPSAFFQTLVNDADAAALLGSLGITASVAELNHVGGVTSAIQTQLDAKLASASYTAADVLSKLLTVDGSTSLLDADLLDGSSSASFAPSSVDYLVGTANGTLTGEIAVGTTPGGELGGTWASPTLDDGITVDTWTLGSATVGATAAANDNDTSLATTAFVQQEVDDVDFLSDNCVLENDSTPIPDSCVGDGSDAGGGGGGLSYAEVAAAVMSGF